MSNREELEKIISSYLFGLLDSQTAQQIENFFKTTLKSKLGEKGYSIIHNNKNMTYDLQLDSEYMSEEDLMSIYGILVQK